MKYEILKMWSEYIEYWETENQKVVEASRGEASIPEPSWEGCLNWHLEKLIKG